MVYWIVASCMKAKREQVNDKLIVIKLFGRNCAKDLMTIYILENPMLGKQLILMISKLRSKILNISIDYLRVGDLFFDFVR